MPASAAVAAPATTAAPVSKTGTPRCGLDVLADVGAGDAAHVGSTTWRHEANAPGGAPGVRAASAAAADKQPVALTGGAAQTKPSAWSTERLLESCVGRHDPRGGGVNGSAPPSLLDGAGDAGALALLSAANSSGASEEARRSARESLLAVKRAPELPPPLSTRVRVGEEPSGTKRGAATNGAGDDDANPRGDGDGEVAEDSDMQKKSLRRERNREHARNSRERKRQRLELLQVENDELRDHFGALRDENLKLRLLLNRLLGSEAAETSGDAAGVAPDNGGHPNAQAQEATT